ncbi:MAG: PKD domain-containing protein [Candidatus Margulisbacteria bacterium]|jgi:PKD repeat protein|nr:PKD domain-containing protein [Candidatus Margulisiibacteriota bacterium]
MSDLFGDLGGYVSSVFRAKAPSLAGCSSQPDICSTEDPKVMNADISSDPAFIPPDQWAKGVTLTWKTASPNAFTNCNDSLDNIKLIVHFGDEKMEVLPDAGGYFTITKTFTKAPTGAFAADLQYTNMNNGEVKVKANAARLHPPQAESAVNDCAKYPWPKIIPGYSINAQNKDLTKTDFREGDTVIVSYPAAGVLACDNQSSARLTANYIVNGHPLTEGLTKLVDGQYTAEIKLIGQIVGNPYEIALQFTDPQLATIPDAQPAYVSLKIYPQTESVLPTATISSNLAYSYHIGDKVDNITCYSDNSKAQFAWTVTVPGPNVGGEVVETLPAGATIASYQFARLGSYDFKCKVTVGTVTREIIHPVQVYPSPVILPTASIIAPYSAKIGSAVTFAAGDPDESLYKYEWTFGDGNSTSGTVANKAYEKTGTYTVILTARRLDDPSVYSTTTQSITIAPPSVTPPTLSLQAPYSAKLGEKVSLSIASADIKNWAYQINFGDGSKPVDNISADYIYPKLGTYTMQVSATSLADPTVKYYVTQNISIVPTAADLPVLSINAPYAAKIGEAVLISVVDPDESRWSYNINYGDGSNEPGTRNSHVYTDQGTKTIRVTAISLSDPTLATYVDQKIAIVPLSVTTPALSMTMPYSAEINTDTVFKVNIPDTAHWTYAWEFGDSTQPGKGDSVTHKYSEIGTKTVRLTATYNDDPSISASISQTINIVPLGKPTLQSLGFTPQVCTTDPEATTGKCPALAYFTLKAAAQAPRTLTEIKVDFGDDVVKPYTPADYYNSATQSYEFNHSYTASGRYTFGIKITLTDSAGQVSTYGGDGSWKFDVY